MEINNQFLTETPVDAASIVMLRDTYDGIEVLLLKRNQASSVLGGLYVFPGGKLDKTDSHPYLLSRLDRPHKQFHKLLSEPSITITHASSLYIAAIREAFEESGILLVDLDHLDTEDAINLHAQALVELKKGVAFVEILQNLGLNLTTKELQPWSRWITPNLPTLSKKRFDTRFFVARVPDDQVAKHDDHEMTHSVWMRPKHALEQYWDRQIEMAAPQIMSLSHLTRYQTVDDVLNEAKKKKPALVQPEPIEQDGVRVLCYPGDELHPVKKRALPGPTRLRVINQRFEPLGGFEDFLN
jgi:8-oxo-dGTP pyrophosphatase MutT (NUDIX family)